MRCGVFTGFLMLCMSMSLNLQAAQIAAPTVAGFSSQFNSTKYAADNTVDGVLGENGDWAAVGTGTHHVDFDFGSITSFASFDYSQRNNVGTPGADAVSQIELFYSNTSGVFGGTPDETFNIADPAELLPSNYPLSATGNAQYVRFQITGVGNPGAGEIIFRDDIPVTVGLVPPSSSAASASTEFDERFPVRNLFDGSPVAADVGTANELINQYAGSGAGPHVVVYDMGSSVDFDGVYFAQRAGSNPSTDKVTGIEFWVTDTDPGAASTSLPILSNPVDGSVTITNTTDNTLTEYGLGTNLSGQFVVMRLTGNGGNPGGTELRLHAVPEPSTALLSFLGLIGIFVFATRKRR